MASSGLVLVTGANGYVGTHVVSQLLEAGYRVRAAVRNQAAAAAVLKLHDTDSLSVEIVPDITVPGAFDEVVKGVDAVQHIASPFTFFVSDLEKEMLIPAIKGTEVLLEAVAAHGPSVKTVVITSSFTAMVDFSKGNAAGYTYTEADWNPVTYDYAKGADVNVAYVASKALAEKAAWKFIEERKPHFKLVTLAAPLVVGPAAHLTNLDNLNISSWDMNRFISGDLQEVPDTVFWAYIDVRDLAKAHVLAIQKPKAGNERFFTVGGRWSYQKLADVLRESPRIPEADRKKVPVGKPGENYPGPNVYEVDNSKSKRILGLEYRPLEESIVESALRLIELKK